MIGIILLSHGNMAKGMYESCQIFFGNDLPQIEAYCLGDNDSPEDMDKWIQEGINKVDDGHGTIILCDLQGGTPYNRCAMFINNRIQVIAGMNFPMLLELLGKRLSTEDIDEINIDELIEVGKTGIMSLNKFVETM